MNCDSSRREEPRIARVINISDPRPMLVEAADGQESLSSCSEPPGDNQNLTVPVRGIVVGTLLSGVCWAALILALRRLSQLVR
jgi:hypothetical protein